MWLGYGQRFTARFRPAAVLEDHGAEHHPSVPGACLSVHCHLIPNLVRQQVVVCIEYTHPLAACQGQQPVSCDVAALVDTALPPHALAKAFDDGETAVRRAVVDDNDFDIAPRLCEGAVDRLADPSLGVETGDENGDHGGDGNARGEAPPAIAAMSVLTGNPARYFRRAWATCQRNVSK